MPVPESSVKVGEYFVTVGGQLRKVTKLDLDGQGRVRVHYARKSAEIANREFEAGHTIANPPLLDTFANDCDKRLDATAVAGLRNRNIILRNE